MSASTPAASAPSFQPEDKPLLESRHTGLLMAAIMGVTVIQFLDLTIANIALPHMQTSLGASMDQISWTLTSFIIAGVMVLPLTGWLADRLGSRNLLIGSTFLFLLASMLCGAATSLAQMVVFRALQGVGAALMAPLAQSAMFDINAPSKQARAMGLFGMVVMIGPISGPFLGGYLTEYLNWRWVFYVNLPIGIPALVLMWWLLPSRPIVKRQLDVLAAVVLAIGLVALQLMLDRGQHKDWFESKEVVAELIVALSAFWVVYVQSRTSRHPLFDGEMIFNSNFMVGLGLMVILGIANVGLSAVLPTFLQTVYRYDVMDTGVLLMTRGVGVLTTMIVTNFLISRIDGRVLISVGYGIAAASLYMMSGWSLQISSADIMLAGYVQGLGLGLIFVPVNMAAFATLAPRFRTDGTTLMTLARNLGGSFGISVIVTLLARNIQVSHSDIAANVTSFNLPAIDPVSTSQSLGRVGAGLLVALDGEVNRQAAMIAYLDNFYLLFWTVIAFIPIVWLMKRPQIGRPTQPMMHD